MRLDASIVIDRPVGDVWRFYAVNLGADIPWLEESCDSQFISGQIQGGIRRSPERIKSLIEAEVPPP